MKRIFTILLCCLFVGGTLSGITTNAKENMDITQNVESMDTVSSNPPKAKNLEMEMVNSDGGSNNRVEIGNTFSQNTAQGALVSEIQNSNSISDSAGVRYGMESKKPIPESLCFQEEYPKVDLDFDENEVAPNQVIVGFNAEDMSYAPDELISKYGGEIIDRNENLNSILIDIHHNDIKSYMKQLKNEAYIKYTNPNSFCKIAMVPNDNDYQNQWGPQQINAEIAWDVTTGDNNIVIAIIDTGIDYNHPDLNNNMWNNPGEIPNNGIDDDGNGYVDDYYGIDFVPLIGYNGDPMDDNGHGSHCAGIAAAEINNNLNIAGMSQVKLMAVKVLNDNNNGWIWDVADGIDYAMNNGADIISMSLEFNSGWPSVLDAVNNAWGMGIILVAATGNDGASSIDYPARYANVIAVGATTKSNVRASYSNYGSELEIMAPGSMIWSTILNNDCDYMWGTSQATPHVAGAAALIWSHEPSLTNQEVRTRLQDTCLDLDTPGWDIETGYGLLDIGKAITSDLIVEDIWTSPTNPIGGQTAIINTRIRNQGYSITTGGFYAKLFIDGSQYNLWSTGSLFPGSYIDLQKSEILNEGIHILHVVADTSLEIPEYDETNNELIISKTWSGPSSISISETLNPSSCYPSDLVQVYGTATYNTGDPVIYTDVDITVSGSTWVTTTDNSGYYSEYITAPSSAGSYPVGVSIISGGSSGVNSKTLTVNPTSGGSFYTIDHWTTCKDVDWPGSGLPIDETEVFRSSDAAAYTWIYLTNINNDLTVSWDWYDPNNNHYWGPTTYFIPNQGGGGFYCWASIYISGFLAEDLEGPYTCNVEINEGSGFVPKFVDYLTVRYEVVERRMCKDVGPPPSYDPINPTDSFLNTDTYAYAWIGLERVAESLDVEWRWFDPSSTLRDTIPWTIPDPSTQGWPYYDWYHYFSYVPIYGTFRQSLCGEWRVDSYIKDVYGNWDLEYSQYFTITDNTVPGVPGTPSDGGVYSTTSTVTWTWTSASEDDVVSQYRIQVGTSQGSNDYYDGYLPGSQLDKTLSGLNEGQIYYARVRAMNGVGQWGDWSGDSDGITIDTFPPSTSILLSGTLGNNGIYISDVTATLSANDPTSGVSETRYRINGGSWQVGTSFPLTGDGSYLVEYYSNDVAGNSEAVNQEMVIIDTTGPLVLSTDPVNSEINVLVTDLINITFNEVIDNISFIYTIEPNPGGLSELWNITNEYVTINHNALTNNTRYWINITSTTDLAGNDLSSLPYSFYFETEGSAATATGPGGNSNDPNIILTYTTQNNPPSVDLYYTNDDVAPYTWTFIGTDSPCDGIYPWTVPFEGVYHWLANTLEEGIPSTLDPPEAFYFEFDMTPPNIISTFPTHGATNVPINTIVQIEFDETVNTTSFTFTCTPDPGGWVLAWSAGDSVVTMTHNNFAYYTSYDVNILYVEDLAGNNLVSPYPFQFTTVPQSYDIPLHLGWNLLSFPLVPLNTSIENVLGSISGAWDVAQYYDNSEPEPGDKWKTYATFKPPSMNTLWDIDNIMGFWLHVTDDSIPLTIYGIEQSVTVIPLLAGWNLVGYSTYDCTVTMALALWGTGADHVEVYNASAEYLLKEIDPSYIMTPGQGYWVHVPFDAVWVIDW